jgi:hypothetical protein
VKRGRKHRDDNIVYVSSLEWHNRIDNTQKLEMRRLQLCILDASSCSIYTVMKIYSYNGDLEETKTALQMYVRYFNIKVNKNPSSRSRV